MNNKPDEILVTLGAALQWIETHFHGDTDMCEQNIQHFVKNAKKLLEQHK